jgi:hypothetical protein
VKLEELEFTAEDSNMSGRDAMHVKGITVESANRILREKLENAPEVFGGRSSLAGMNFHTVARGTPTHTARLVCIEKLKEQGE